MVYCGRPSKSCKECRRRDIKCDKRRESCGQCKRASIRCSGYIDSQVMVFRDETKRIIVNSKKKTILLNPETPVASRSTCLSSTETCLPRETLLGTQTKHEMTNYVSELPSTLLLPNSPEELAKSYYIYLSPAYLPSYDLLRGYNPTPTTLLHLVYATRAVSLLYLSKYHSSSALLHTARRNYGAALRYTHAQVVGKGAREDSTLVAVLFLGAWERMVDGSGNRKHLEGALALVDARAIGKNDEVGGGLLRFLAATVWARCLEREKEVPRRILKIREVSERRIIELDISWRLQEIMVKFCKLKAELKLRGWADGDEILVGKMINECAELDSLIRTERDEKVPEIPRKLVVNLSEETMFSSRRFIQLSIVRLCLAETLRHGSSSFSTNGSLEAICKTIFEVATRGMTRDEYLFSLYVVAGSCFCPENMKERIVHHLRRMGTHNALRVVELLEMKHGATNDTFKNPWLEFADGGLGELNVFVID